MGLFSTVFYTSEPRNARLARVPRIHEITAGPVSGGDVDSLKSAARSHQNSDVYFRVGLSPRKEPSRCSVMTLTSQFKTLTRAKA